MAENEFTITESPEVTALRVTEVSPRGHARQSSGSPDYSLLLAGRERLHRTRHEGD